ncbi:ATP-binding protein [Heliorestis convoluta]|uniref:Circadian input-output histidine kinase CikA n=1 Tax=Heliorestis convoluta TaxID=356322 RepID=A0A5Q2MY20_9FIRM|nr:ATP-binding protein [Heliorestis convoluta]QGG46273.1 PAS/PAC sensor hybrid histidine kinase [Heliorestis convoluta]
MRALLVVTDQDNLDRLSLYLRTTSGVEIVGIARDIKEFIDLLVKKEIDSLYLDMELQNLDSIHVVKTLLNDRDVEVVLVTSPSVDACQAYEIAPLDIILKPITEKAVRRSLYRLTERIQEKRRLRQAEDGERLLSDISFQVLDWQPLDRILHFACDKMVQIFDLPLAWVALRKHDGTVTIEASAGILSNYIKSPFFQREEIYHQAQPIQADYVEEVTKRHLEGIFITDPYFQLRKEKEVCNSVSFCLVVPLKTKQSVLGYLALYAGTYELLKARQIAAFKRCAEQVCIALAGAIRRQEVHLLTTAVESSANAIVITDPTAKVIWCNEAFEKLSGYELDEIKGIKPSFWKSGFHSSSFYENMWSTILKGKVWKGETVNKRKGGDFYTEEMTITPVKDEQGNLVNYIAMKEDITLRKEVEMTLLKAKEEAEQAERVKSEFLSVISHELRTPMSGILGMNELLLDTDLDQEQRILASAVEESAQDLLKIIDALLTFSSIQAGRKSLNYTFFDMKAFLNEFIERINYSILSKGLTFQANIEPSVEGTWCGDPLRLRQILDNIIDNAIKFTEKGEILFKVSLQKESNEPFLQFEVIDSGIGMPRDVQKKLFIPFTQKDSSLGRRYGGIGLGLTISKYLIELMGGTIAVTSAEKKGTVVSFTLPSEPASNADWIE